MTLGQFAVAVGATPRWVLNALTRLKVRRRYDEPLARRLALARMLGGELGMPLDRAFELAGRALAEADPQGQWRKESDNGAVILVIDMPRFFTRFGTRLAVARNKYGERLRGRRPHKRRSAVQRAREFGVDVTLIDSQLRRTPEQRFKMVAEEMHFFSAIRGTAGGGTDLPH